MPGVISHFDSMHSGVCRPAPAEGTRAVSTHVQGWTIRCCMSCQGFCAAVGCCSFAQRGTAALGPAALAQAAAP